MVCCRAARDRQPAGRDAGAAQHPGAAPPGQAARGPALPGVLQVGLGIRAQGSRSGLGLEALGSRPDSGQGHSQKSKQAGCIQGAQPALLGVLRVVQRADTGVSTQYCLREGPAQACLPAGSSVLPTPAAGWGAPACAQQARSAMARVGQSLLGPCPLTLRTSRCHRLCGRTPLLPPRMRQLEACLVCAGLPWWPACCCSSRGVGCRRAGAACSRWATSPPSTTCWPPRGAPARASTG